MEPQFLLLHMYKIIKCRDTTAEIMPDIVAIKIAYPKSGCFVFLNREDMMPISSTATAGGLYTSKIV